RRSSGRAPGPSPNAFDVYGRPTRRDPGPGRNGAPRRRKLSRSSEPCGRARASTSPLPRWRSRGLVVVVRAGCGPGSGSGGAAGQLLRLLLRIQRELHGLEGVLLGHGVLGAVQDIEDQLAEEGVAHLAGGVDAVLALAVDQDHLAAAVVGGDVHVLAQLDVALGAEDEGAAVAPGAQTLRSEPVHAHEARRPGGERDVRVAVVVELGMLGVAEVADRAGEDLAVLGAGEGEHL